MTDEQLEFPDRESFRAWLATHAEGPGVWLLLRKKGAKTITAAQALEEALCYGWIDGQMESLDDSRYIKYFAPRNPRSKWSDKNRKLAEKLQKEGRMTRRGELLIQEAKNRGVFACAPRTAISDEQVSILEQALAPYQTALVHFQGMTPSAKRAYTGGFLSVKTETGREKKLAQLVERLELGLNPMASLAKKKAELEKQGVE